MILVGIIVLVSVLAAASVVALFLKQPLGGDLDVIAAGIREIDVESFRNLVDPGEQSYLRDHLSSWRFRMVQFLRMWAAAGYMWGAAMNARRMIQLAEAAKRDASPAVLAKAETVQQNASVLCLHALQTVPQFWLSAVIPEVANSAEFLSTRYASLFRDALILKLLWRSERAVSIKGAVVQSVATQLAS